MLLLLVTFSKCLHRFFSSKQELLAAFKVGRSDAANQSSRLKYQFDGCSSSERGKNSSWTLLNVNVPTLWKTET